MSQPNAPARNQPLNELKMNEEVIHEIAEKISEPIDLVRPVMDDEYDDTSARKIDGAHANDIHRMRRWIVAQLVAQNGDADCLGPFVPGTHAP